MNDTNTTHPFPDEADIHAYVDGRLDATDAARMDVWLQQHPQRAEEIRRWQRDAQQLRVGLGGLPDAAGRSSLDPRMIRARRRHRTRARMAMAAMLVVALGIGGFGGWQVRGRTVSASTTAPMADALQAYRMFALNRHRPFDVTSRQPGDMQTWLDRHFDHATRLPDLGKAGFRPVGARLIATASGPAAMVLYENRQGSAISFYIRTPSPTHGILPHGQRREGQLAAAYWSGQGYNYALVSRADAPDVHLIRKASLASRT